MCPVTILSMIKSSSISVPDIVSPVNGLYVVDYLKSLDMKTRNQISFVPHWHIARRLPNGFAYSYFWALVHKILQPFVCIHTAVHHTQTPKHPKHTCPVQFGSLFIYGCVPVAMFTFHFENL